MKKAPQPMKSATGTAEGGRPSYEQRWFQAFPGHGDDYAERWRATFDAPQREATGNALFDSIEQSRLQAAVLATGRLNFLAEVRRHIDASTPPPEEEPKP